MSGETRRTPLVREAKRRMVPASTLSSGCSIRFVYADPYAQNIGPSNIRAAVPLLCLISKTTNDRLKHTEQNTHDNRKLSFSNQTDTDTGVDTQFPMVLTQCSNWTLISNTSDLF